MKTKLMEPRDILWNDAIKKDGWEKRYNDKFNKSNQFLVYKFLPKETYSEAVWEVRDFIAEEIARSNRQTSIAMIEEMIEMVECKIVKIDTFMVIEILVLKQLKQEVKKSLSELEGAK